MAKLYLFFALLFAIEIVQSFNKSFYFYRWIITIEKKNAKTIYLSEKSSEKILLIKAMWEEKKRKRNQFSKSTPFSKCLFCFPSFTILFLYLIRSHFMLYCVVVIFFLLLLFFSTLISMKYCALRREKEKKKKENENERLSKSTFTMYCDIVQKLKKNHWTWFN